METFARARRHLVAGLTGCLMLACLAGAAAPASAATLKKGIYDCTTGSGAYVNSVKIMAGGKYLLASGRKGSTLRQTTKGTYKVTGAKIKWLTGVYKKGKYASEIYKGYFSIDRAADGVWTGVSCNHLPKPNGAVGV